MAGAATKADGQETRRAATLPELKAKFPEASAEFYLAQIEAQATIEDAAIAFAADCLQQKKASDEAARAAQAEAEKAKTEAAKQQKVQPPAARASDAVEGISGSVAGELKAKAPAGCEAKAEFLSAVDAKVKEGMSRGAAISAVAAEQPELHLAFIRAHNEGLSPYQPSRTPAA